MNVYERLVMQKDSFEECAINFENGRHSASIRGMILGTKMALDIVMDTVAVGDLAECETR